MNMLRLRSFWLLLLANVLTAGITFVSSCNSPFADGASYLQLADGLVAGRFSSWYMLPQYIPETLRMWGYPFFLSIFRRFSDGELPIKCFQLALHFVSLFVILRIIAHRVKGAAPQLLFLLLAALNIQVPYYAGQISAESTTGFFLVLYCYVLMIPRRSLLCGAFAGLIAAVTFQLRPGYLYLPFIITAACIILPGAVKSNRGFFISKILVFVLLLVPFGLWNKRHHGQFKITSLAGAASGAHFGYWAFLLPRDYHANFIWGAAPIPNEFFMFSLYRIPDSEREKNAAMFEAEKGALFAEIESLETEDERKRIRLMEHLYPGVYSLHNSRYTIARERAQRKLLLKHIAEKPGDYFFARAITFVRLWFTGVNLTELGLAKSPLAKAKVVLPFLITFSFIFLGLIFVAIGLSLGIIDWHQWMVPFVIPVYAAASHTAFPISARYTVPTHLLLLMLVAVATIEGLKAWASPGLRSPGREVPPGPMSG